MQGMWRIEDCSSVRKKRDIEELDGKISLDSDFLEAIGTTSKLNDTRTLALSERLEDDQLLDGSNRTRVGKFVSQVANTKDNEEKEKPLQRKRRHHDGDHAHHHMSRKPLAIDSSNQPEIATSSGARPSSWINDLFGWVKGSVGGLFYSRAALSEEASNTASSIPQANEQFAKASVSTSSSNGNLGTEEITKHKLEFKENIPNSTSIALPSDGADKKQESNYFTSGVFFRDNVDYVNANLKQMHERQILVKFKPSGGNAILEMGYYYLSQIDFNGTIMLLDVLIRKVTGQKYISTADQHVPLLEAQGYALNIIEEFEKVLNEAAIKSGISAINLSFNPVKTQLVIVGQIRNGKFSEISKTLYSFAKEACPEFKQRGKFLAHLGSHLEEVLAEKGTICLQQKVEQISKTSNQPTSSVLRSEILKKLQDIKNILNKSIQNKSVIKSPLYNNIVKDIRGNIRLTRKNHDQKEEVLKNLRDIHKSCIAICELIQGDCWDSLKHSLSNNLPLSNKYNFKAAYTNLSIIVEVLKLLYDRDLCRTVIDSDENISLNGVISLQKKMEKMLVDNEIANKGDSSHVVSGNSSADVHETDQGCRSLGNLIEGKAVTNGSCFFDSFRQGLEQQKGIKATVEQLRNDCKGFAQDNPPKWFKHAIARSYDSNGQRRNEAVGNYTTNIIDNNRWGDPEVEGRILCGKYGVKLHVVESNLLRADDNQQDQFLHQLIDNAGSKSVGEYNVDYDDNSVLHIINRGTNHFQPLLDGKRIQKPQRKTSQKASIAEDQENMARSADRDIGKGIPLDDIISLQKKMKKGLEESNIQKQQRGFNLGSERPQSCLNNVFVQNHLSQDLPPGKSVYLIS